MIIIDNTNVMKMVNRVKNYTPEYVSVPECKARRDKDVQDLADLLPLRQKELLEELQHAYPDVKRVKNLRRIVSDLQHTLNAAQQQR